MRWVQQPAIRPHKCAVFPQVGGHNSRLGFIDTGQDARADDHIYISVEAAQEMGRFIGWGPPDAALKAKCERLEREVSQLKAEVAEADRFAEAAEYTMERFGTKVRAKPGRKKTAA